MSIMERLSSVEPYFRRGKLINNRKYRIVESHFGEIEQAKSNGYSWHQIKDALCDEVKAVGDWDEEWNCWGWIQAMYYLIKKQKDTALADGINQ